MKIDDILLRKIIEGALLAAGGPLSVAKIASLFEPPEGTEPDADLDPQEKPGKEEILAALEDIQADCKGRGYELKEVGSGWRFQVVQETAPWISRLWEEKPQKYSRALLETLALIAYRQPITRGDIESIRGVAVSSTIIKTLTEREWVKVVGHRDVPGRPALYATTRQFLDYFNLKSLDELPSLKEIQDLDQMDADLSLKEMLGGAAGRDPSIDAANDQAGDADQSAEQVEPAGESVAETQLGSEEAFEEAESRSDDEFAGSEQTADDEYSQESPPDDVDPVNASDDYPISEEESSDDFDESADWEEDSRQTASDLDETAEAPAEDSER
jgi:segregation and condensation protein B